MFECVIDEFALKVLRERLVAASLSVRHGLCFKVSEGKMVLGHD